MINLKEESIDDLADLYEFMREFTYDQCIRLYGFSAEMVMKELDLREDSLINQ